MQRSVHKQAKQYLRNHKKWKNWQKIVMSMACVVVFCTVYALILPAITANSKTSCGYEEHVHTEKCSEKELICEIPSEISVHTHSDACVEYKKELSCEKEENEGHTHTEACYTEFSTYICGMEEGQEIEKHEHTDECYKIVDKCDKEEHEHKLACFSDPDADVETKEIWERTFREIKLTGDWSEDLISIAESQLGYEESTENYVVENDKKLGYTRYGDWYGNKYGHWCAMYVSFCLNYAEVEGIPFEAGCQNWIEKLSEETYELYREAKDYTPVRGDLIFFNWDKEPDSDHVGIVVEYIEATENEPARIKTIEGNASNEVKYESYDADYNQIMGYAILPEEPEENLSEEMIELVQETDLFTATATFEKGVLPEDTELNVELLNKEEKEKQALESYVQEEGKALLTSQHMEIDFLEKSGKEVEPEGDVRFKIQFNEPMTASETPTEAVGDETTEAASTEWMLYRIADSSEVSAVDREDVSLTEIGDDTALQTAAFAYEPAATYAVAAVAQERAAGIDTLDELRTAISNANETGVTVLTLTGSFESDGKIDIINKAIVLDLAGHTITAKTGTVFDVKGGGSLTIRDSAFVESEIKKEKVSTTNVSGNLATYENDVLIYYVTESEVTNSNTGATTETLQKYTVPIKGKIQAAGNNAIYVADNNSIFTLESGAIVGGTNRAINQVGGTVNLAGGYICGSKVDGDHGTEANANGGAVHTSGGKLDISGTVIAANTATGRGGAIAVSGANTELHITGGVISGNQATTAANSGEGGTHYGGGGVYCYGGSKVVMNGGFITNNTSAAIGYFDGGGGVLVDGTNTQFVLNGGYITGNEATSGGGIRTDWRSASTVYIYGGYICSNYARKAEGGGVCINMEGSAWIEGGYINNNRTDTPNHWGGGGVFCSNGSRIFMQNALITENDAGGFGGGVAGCSTGRVYITVKEGGAIYGNEAAGQNMSGDGTTKPEDHELGKNNETFIKYGYQDYFCALNSMVEGTMLGGYSAEWRGSADGYPVTAGKGETLTASSVMGLTAYPKEEGKNAAQSAAKLYVNGNYSNTHGGGVLANGYLIIGEMKDIYVNARIELSGTKEYFNEKSEPIEMTAGEFKFAVVDEDTDAIITEGTNDTDGNIRFKDRIPFSKEGTYKYLVKELEVDDVSVTTDTTVYRITIIVKKESTDWLKDGDEVLIKRHQYLVDTVKVEKKVNGEWEPVSETKPGNHEDGPIKMVLTGDTTFTNYKLESTNIKVVKQWTEDDPHPNSVTVGLYQNGTLYGEKVTLNASNNWTYIWENVPIKDGDALHKYTVKEDEVHGYQAEYDFYSIVSSTGYWIPASQITEGQRYILVSPNGDYVFRVIDDHLNARISSADKKTIQKGTGEIKIGDVTYTDYYSVEQVEDRSIYTALKGSTNNKDLTGIYLLSKSVSSAILVEPDGNQNILKGGTGISGGYFSLFSYSPTTGMVGKKGWGGNKNNEYRVTYDSSNKRFSAVSTNTGYDANTAVKLYTYAEAPVSQKEYVYVINNTKDENITYGLDLTKISSDDANVKLSGAYFNLKNVDGQVLHFISSTTAGAYTWSATQSAETTTELITADKGKLVLRGLPAGTYTLVETKAPAGYKVAEPQEVVLGADPSNPTLKIEIVDFHEDEFIIPETGGIGTNMFTIGGMFLIMSSLLIGFTVKRKRERGIR